MFLTKKNTTILKFTIITCGAITQNISDVVLREMQMLIQMIVGCRQINLLVCKQIFVSTFSKIVAGETGVTFQIFKLNKKKQYETNSNRQRRGGDSFS